MRCAFVVRMLEEDGSSRIVASWLNFPPIIIWFMANMDDKLLDEKLHLFDLNKLSLLCGSRAHELWNGNHPAVEFAFRQAPCEVQF